LCRAAHQQRDVCTPPLKYHYYNCSNGVTVYRAAVLSNAQCRIAVDAAELGPFKTYAHGHGRENEKNLKIFLLGTVSGKSLRLLPPDVIF